MEIRVIVPINWDSDLRRELLKALKFRGYTWRCGEDLESNQPNCMNAKYIAISTTHPVISYSSHFDIVDKVSSSCGYNYILPTPSVKRAIQTVQLIQNYWLHKLDEDQIVALLQEHRTLLDTII